MKRFLSIAFACLAFCSCKKDSSPVKGSVFGTWELRVYSTGWSPLQHFAPGNGNKYVFKADSTYVKYKDNAVEKQGRFSINIRGKEGDMKYGTISLTNPAYSDAFNIRRDTINIGTSIADGATAQFVRINE